MLASESGQSICIDSQRGAEALDSYRFQEVFAHGKAMFLGQKRRSLRIDWIPARHESKYYSKVRGSQTLYDFESINIRHANFAQYEGVAIFLF